MSSWATEYISIFTPDLVRSLNPQTLNCNNARLWQESRAISASHHHSHRSLALPESRDRVRKPPIVRHLFLLLLLQPEKERVRGMDGERLTPMWFRGGETIIGRDQSSLACFMESRTPALCKLFLISSSNGVQSAVLTLSNDPSCKTVSTTVSSGLYLLIVFLYSRYKTHNQSKQAAFKQVYVHC